MKKIFVILLAATMIVSTVACGETKTNSADMLNNNSSAIEEQDDIVSNDDSINEPANALVQIKESPDKYTWYIKNYVGKNCATLGYTSYDGNRMDEYGAGILELIFVCSDGTYIDISSDDALKEYTVIGQNLTPNTELKYVFDKDSKGNEYDNLIAYQNHEKIVLNVKKVGSSDSSISMTAINPSPDKYTWYVADYVGRNLANCGYISWDGNLMDEYGAGAIELIIVADDGSYVDPSDEELLKCYVVTGQSITPNTELSLVFDKDSNGVEYDNLVETQNIEEIEVYVKRIPGIEPSAPVEEEKETPTAEPKKDESVPSEDISNTTLVDGLRPEFKEAMDSYEAFYTEYCDFMKKFSENPTDLTLLAKYGDMLAKATEMNEAFEAWDENELNTEELKYYLDVNTRVMQKMVDIVG